MKSDYIPMKLKLLYAVTALVAVSGALLALSTPPDAVQRTYARILHLHVPSAWLAFLAFGVTALGSVMWRLRRRLVWDRLAASSAEIGVLFTGLAILTVVMGFNFLGDAVRDWLDPHARHR